jgi:hypothetical protein
VTAVVNTDGPSVVGSGGRDLSPAQRLALADGEIPSALAGEHAEVTAVSGAIQQGFDTQVDRNFLGLL